MSTRNRLLTVLLWISVIMFSTWIGGTLYQMLVIVPLWSGSPPESVREFFQGTDYTRTVYHFGPPFMAVRNVPLVLALFVGWNQPQHRILLTIAVLCFLVFGVVITLAYVYPINAVLFHQAGGEGSPEEIRAMVGKWVFIDRIRFAIGCIGFVALLRAFRQPITSPGPAEWRGDPPVARWR